MKLQGKVVRQPWAQGSKSEHQAVVLQTSQGAFKLRRPGGNAFHDQELEKLVGHEIACEGEIHSGQLLMTQWSVAPGRG
jgi:hypothetical protein